MFSQPQIEAVSLALQDIEDGQLLEYQFLFVLAGRLRGTEPGLRQSDRRAAEKFLPLALDFAKKVVKNDLAHGFIEWDDADSVKLEFLKAWSSRRLPKDSLLFESAVEHSAANPLQLPDDRNKWVNRIANLAFCLSEMLPDTPLIIPVSEKTAGMLGISLRTLSLAMQEVIREKLVLVIVKPDQALPRRLARRLKFNARHPLVSKGIEGARKRLRESLSI